MYNFKKLANIIFISCLALSLTIYISRKAEVNKYLIKDIKNKESKNFKIHINSATVKDFTNLPGIGPSLAKRIIDYRNKNGSFETTQSLQQVKGIGNSKYLKIEKYLTIKR